MCYAGGMNPSQQPPHETWGQASEALHNLWASVRTRLEMIVAQGGSLSERVDSALRMMGEELEQRIRANRARLFAWTGAPATETLDAIAERIAALESRLEQIDRTLAALNPPQTEDASWHGAQQH